jgi:low temperature requirement protein LtrA
VSEGEAPAPAAAPGGARVTTLELFFDLVFVFTVTQLSDLLAHALTWRGLLHVALLLGVIFYMYGGYAWLTNAIPVDAAANRALLLAGMCGYFVMALAVPGAFDGSGLTFGLAYAVVVLVHFWLFVHASGDASGAMLRLAPANLGGGALVLLGGALGGDAETVLWAVAFAVMWIGLALIGIGDFSVAPAHFVERHGLVVLIAIGESVVAIGIGAGELAVNAELVLVAVLGLLLSAALWWTYFGGDDTRAERALAALDQRARAHAALAAFGWAHLVLLLGVVCVAVGLKQATGHAYDTLEGAQALVLAGGAAIFLAGDAWFRALLAIGTPAVRAAGAVVALATIPLGTEVAAVAQVGALAAVVAVAAGMSARGRPAQVLTS